MPACRVSKQQYLPAAVEQAVPYRFIHGCQEHQRAGCLVLGCCRGLAKADGHIAGIGLPVSAMLECRQPGFRQVIRWQGTVWRRTRERAADWFGYCGRGWCDSGVGQGHEQGQCLLVAAVDVLMLGLVVVRQQALVTAGFAGALAVNCGFFQLGQSFQRPDAAGGFMVVNDLQRSTGHGGQICRIAGQPGQYAGAPFGCLVE